jgi:hypothetical protein
MKHSEQRILTTHAGSLPRPPALRDLLVRPMAVQLRMSMGWCGRREVHSTRQTPHRRTSRDIATRSAVSGNVVVCVNEAAEILDEVLTEIAHGNRL